MMSRTGSTTCLRGQSQRFNSNPDRLQGVAASKNFSMIPRVLEGMNST